MRLPKADKYEIRIYRPDEDGRTLLTALTAAEAIALARKHGSGSDSLGARITAIKNGVGREVGGVIRGIEMTGKQWREYLPDEGVMGAKVEASRTCE